MKSINIILSFFVLASVFAGCRPSQENKVTSDPVAVEEESRENISQYKEFLGADVSATPMIIDFYATWCGPCMRMAPSLEALAEEYKGKVNVIKVDVDARQDFATAAGISAMPTLFFIDREGNIERHVGALDAATLRQDFDGLQK